MSARKFLENNFIFIIQLTSISISLCIFKCNVKIAWDLDDCTFIFVLAVVRDRAPTWRHWRAYVREKKKYIYKNMYKCEKKKTFSEK